MHYNTAEIIAIAAFLIENWKTNWPV